jgi:hypothetical protein
MAVLSDTAMNQISALVESNHRTLRIVPIEKLVQDLSPISALIHRPDAPGANPAVHRVNESRQLIILTLEVFCLLRISLAVKGDDPTMLTISRQIESIRRERLRKLQGRRHFPFSNKPNPFAGS